MRTAELVSIGSVFSRRENDQYTKSARTYQSILKYCLFLKQNRQSEYGDNQSFTWWEFTDWLTKDPSNSSDKSTKDRVENPQRTIKKKLQNLVDLDLIQISGNRPVTKGIGTTPTYQCTKHGYLVAWIIESFDENCDEILIQDEIYTLVSEIFTIREHSSASNIFFSKFVKKCNDANEFRNIVSLFRQAIYDGNIIKMTDLFNYIWRLDFEDLNTRTRFNNIFLEILDELDPEIQNLILHALKLDIERRMRAAADNFENFEQARFMVRADYNKVALECACIKCDRSLYIGIGLRHYRKSVVDSYPEWTGFLSEICPQCKTDSLIIHIV